MNSYQKRILAGVGVGIAIVSAVYIPLKKDAVVHTACASLLLAALLSGASLWQLSKSISRDYVTAVAFPLAVKSYLWATIGMAVLFVGLDLADVWSMPFAWYSALQVILIGVTAWKLLAIGAAQEAICHRGEEVREAVSQWMLIQADADAILRAAPAGMRKEISAVRDAIRYADPMSHPDVLEQDDRIVDALRTLRTLAAENKVDEVVALCGNVQNLIRERADRLRGLK